MKTMLRLILRVSVLCLLGSVAALVAGVGGVEERPPLRFDPDPFVVPLAMDWSGERDFEVDVVNDSAGPAQLVGAEDFCGVACFSGIGLPTTIPARGRGRVTIRIKPGRPGPFSVNLIFLTDQPAQPRLTMRIEGNIPEVTPLETSTHAANP